MKTLARKSLKRIISAAAALCITLICTLTSYAESSKKYGSINDLANLLNQLEKHLHNVNIGEVPGSYVNVGDYIVSSPEITETDLPESFDLRDVNGKCYVTDVKEQDPFATCWAFSVIAASEISLATSLDIDLNTATEEQKEALDLSEKHLVWFVNTPITKDDKKYPYAAGEGIYSTDFLDTSDKSADELSRMKYATGRSFTASTLFSTGIGPALESDVPYLNNEGYYYYVGLVHLDENKEITDTKILCDDFTESYDEAEAIVESYLKKYPDKAEDVISGDSVPDPNKEYIITLISRNYGDWTVEESKRYNSAYNLINVNYLPSPTHICENGEYEYNELGTLAIKKELYAGHGVTLGFYADQASPGDTIDPNNTYLKFSNIDGSEPKNGEADIWASYCFCKDYDPSDPDSINYIVSGNHGVTVVGYDDNFPKEYFNDPKGTIGGDGAFIVKNSWGYVDSSDPIAAGYWGNGGSGYFYLSYYDQSIEDLMSFSFDTLPDTGVKALKTDVYDFRPHAGPDFGVQTDYAIFSSNVFTAEENEFVDRIGFEVPYPNCTVDYAVYVLSDGFTDPTDGIKAAEGSLKFDYTGYHTVDLGCRVPVRKGQKYSVIISIRLENGKYFYSIPFDINLDGLQYYNAFWKQQYIEVNGSDEGFYGSTSYTYLNADEGQSYVGVQGKKRVKWVDYCKLTDALASDNAKMNNNGFCYDNPIIRAYPKTDLTVIENKIINPKESYKAGDVIRCRITIKNNDSVSLRKVRVKLSLGKLGENNKLGKISVIRPGETKKIYYSYKIKEKDVKNGKLVSTVKVKINGTEPELTEGVSLTTFSVNTAAA